MARLVDTVALHLAFAADCWARAEIHLARWRAIYAGGRS
jgi:hypothetical protein